MVFETKEQIIRRKKIARYRFQALIRKARLNAHWLSELEDLTLGENVAKNITIIFNRSQQKRGVLTIHDKATLRKPPAERTKGETEHLATLFDELPCMSSISPVRNLEVLDANQQTNFFQILRKKLINVCEFQFFEKHRTLLMEGHLSQSMFFILTGEVLISKSMYTAEGCTKVNQLLSSCDHFGHVGLIYNIARNASVVTQSRPNNELLAVSTESLAPRYLFPLIY